MVHGPLSVSSAGKASLGLEGGILSQEGLSQGILVPRVKLADQLPIKPGREGRREGTDYYISGVLHLGTGRK